MKLYIKLQDGQPIDHPMIEENLLQIFPNIDVNLLPSDIIEFERVAVPNLGLYEVYEGTTYQLIDGVCKDVHQVRDMTAEEKIQKQSAMKELNKTSPYPSWTYNEEICGFVPPVPVPDNENPYKWDEETLSWLTVTA
jgi:hypothetical protein